MDGTKRIDIRIPAEKGYSFNDVYNLIDWFAKHYLDDEIVPFGYVVPAEEILEDLSIHTFSGDLIIGMFSDDISDYFKARKHDTMVRLYTKKTRWSFIVIRSSIDNPVSFIEVKVQPASFDLTLIKKLSSLLGGELQLDRNT